MKNPIKKLREFLKNAANPFQYDFEETAAENYDYAPTQYDSDEIEITTLDLIDDHERVLEIGFDFITSHDVSAGGWDEEPCHDIELKHFTINKIVFWYENEEIDFSNNRAAIEAVKNYMENE